MKNPVSQKKNSTVSADSFVLTSQYIVTSWVFGIFTSHLYNCFTTSGIWLKCNRFFCAMPHVKGSWVMPNYSSTNFLSLHPIARTTYPSLGSLLHTDLEENWMVLKGTLSYVSCFHMVFEACFNTEYVALRLWSLKAIFQKGLVS